MAAQLDIDIQLRLTAQGRVFELDIQLHSGAQRLALLGPSGAGKSATLRAIAGLQTPHSGHVRLGGRSLFDAAAGINLPVRQRRIGMVFQDYALFPHLTVAQNIAFGVSRFGLPAAADKAAYAEALTAQYGLQAMANALPRDLSGGQRQRVAVVRALATQPQLLLLDEPFSALDTPLRQRLRDELRSLLDQVALPIVIVSHDPDDVAALAQSVVHMAHGRVVAAPP
jgi:molybdate transport system ATP-binding protein